MTPYIWTICILFLSSKISIQETVSAHPIHRYDFPCPLTSMELPIQDIHSSTTPGPQTLLCLPKEYIHSTSPRGQILTSYSRIRDMTWAYCLHFEDDVEIAIMAQRMVSCKGGLRIPGKEALTAFTPQLLRINKQIRREGFVIMCNSNNFSIVLNQASYLGYPSRVPRSFVSVAGGELASIPSKWTSDIRDLVREMRNLVSHLFSLIKPLFTMFWGRRPSPPCQTSLLTLETS